MTPQQRQDGDEARMFEGFISERINCGEVTLFVRRTPGVRDGVAGKPPLLMLHGYPQTSAMWRDVAPRLAESFEVICPDLRGYGASDRPGTDRPGQDQTHALYSKRAMAQDMTALMTALGHETFFLVGHDRGGRVSHRLAMDHSARVRRLVVMDIAPTREMYARADARFAKAYWHWFFLIQPYPVPEQMIGADPDGYWRAKCMELGGGKHPFSDEALEEYISFHRQPAALHAQCEDYRAAYSIDIEHDNEDGDAKLSMPLHVIWGKAGIIDRYYDAIQIWQERAETVTGQGIEGSHYFAEERPEETAEAIRSFLQGSPEA